MNTCRLFENLAVRAWNRIRDGHTYSIRQGEEGLSDWLLLEILASGLPDVTILKTSKAKESKQGTDWEWWLGQPSTGWFRYAVQAKVIDVESRIYTAVGHKVGTTRQVNLLAQYARAQRAIPIYCLFTYLKGSAVPSLSYPQEQFGCSVCPCDVVANAVQVKGARSFDKLHATGRVFPWRCLVCCPKFVPATGTSNPLSAIDDRPEIYNTLPLWLERALKETDRPFDPPEDAFPEGAAARFLVTQA